MNVPTVTLPSGDEMPVVGAGTWNLHGDTVRKSVRHALENGYTHIDTAEGYQNETEIGDIISEYDRDELFLTSKVTPKNLHYESIIRACEESLKRLQTDYLDLYLIHWPNPAISIRETLSGMNRLCERGLVRNIGVSNFNAYQLSAAQHVSGRPIAVNQIEFHPWYTQRRVVEFCNQTDVQVVGAAPLARTEILDDPTIQDLAEEYDRTPAQIVLRWEIEEDAVVLPKSTSADHLRDNLDLFDWELTDTDRRRIADLACDQPVYDLPGFKWDDEMYGIQR